ncbi:MAG: hydantoinase/oxoprolinase family protein [Gammaproteobacteria bacterium]
MAKSDLRVAIDVGGTFTDIVIADGGRGLYRYKILNDPDRIGAQINERIEHCMREAARTDGVARAVDTIIHGTTICSNAVLEGTGARTGLICTRGFRDILELREGRRPPDNDIFWEPVPALVPRHWRLEVTERLTAAGSTIVDMDEAGLEEAVETLKRQGAEAVAIAFINAYVNPAHEQRALAIAARSMPSAWLCASHEILAEIREYPRTSTTVVNAYVMKTVNQYLDRFCGALGVHDRPIMIMESNGGMMTTAHARRRPVAMLESGPAAGVLAASELARVAGIDRAVAFDMGGTTVKACLIEDGQAAETRDVEVGAGVNGSRGKGAGYPVRIPAFDIVEIGAGGGSIARVIDGTLLRVGPDSAASVPGPACYGRGGDRPTVTDANVVLGYMSPQGIAGGSVPIDLDRARGVLERDVGQPLGLSAQEAAHGIYRVTNATMARAVRAVTSERGRDPRDYTLIAFGGAGPIHAAALAQDLGIRRVVVPLLPGLFSSVGLQFADQAYDRIRTVLLAVTEQNDAGIAAAVAALADLIDQDLPAATRERADVEFVGEFRYPRQGTEIPIWIRGPWGEAARVEILEEFHRMHEKLFGYQRPGEPVVLASLRARATVRTDAGTRSALRTSLSGAAQQGEVGPATRRPAWFGPAHGCIDTVVLERRHLGTEAIAGPIIVEEYDTAIVIPPGWAATLDGHANVVLEHTGGG